MFLLMLVLEIVEHTSREEVEGEEEPELPERLHPLELFLESLEALCVAGIITAFIANASDVFKAIQQGNVKNLMKLQVKDDDEREALLEREMTPVGNGHSSPPAAAAHRPTVHNGWTPAPPVENTAPAPVSHMSPVQPTPAVPGSISPEYTAAAAGMAQVPGDAMPVGEDQEDPMVFC